MKAVYAPPKVWPSPQYLILQLAVVFGSGTVSHDQEYVHPNNVKTEMKENKVKNNLIIQLNILIFYRL